MNFFFKVLFGITMNYHWIDNLNERDLLYAISISNTNIYPIFMTTLMFFSGYAIMYLLQNMVAPIYHKIKLFKTE